MLSRRMSNHRTKERSTGAQHHLAVSRAGCPFWAGSATPFAGGWRAAGGLRGWNLGLGGLCRWAEAWPFGEAAALPRSPSGLLSSRHLFVLPPPSLGSGWVLGKSCPLSSANLQGPGSMGTVRLVQNMCKMIFFTSKVERHPFNKGPFGEGYRRKLRVLFMPKATAGSWCRA